MSNIRIGMSMFILLISMIFPFPTNHAKAAETVTVDAQSLHIRSGPGLTYEVIGSLQKGRTVEVLSSSDDWFEISFGNGNGWIASWLTVSSESSSFEKTVAVSQVNALNIRADASVQSAVIGRLQAGDEVWITSIQGEWAAIEKGGIEGFVHQEYITKSVNQPQPEQPSTTEDSDEDDEMESAPAISLSKADTFTVSVNELQVRKKPTLSSKKAGIIKKGESFAIKEKQGNWLRISIGKKDGWVYSFHGVSSEKQDSTDLEQTDKTVTILTNGTNIRQQATTSSEIVERANAGQKFAVVQETDDWFEIKMPGGNTAFVANWVVSLDSKQEPLSSQTKEKPARVPGTLKGLTIVLDAGHGGRDRGTTGARGTDEKGITLLTAELLSAKLQAAGAEVVMSREADTFVDLRKRVAVSHQHAADAFISLHYDAHIDSSINGFTTYYSHSAHQPLAAAVNEGIGSSVSLRDRGAQFGNFLVLRENQQPSILIELGYLSNPNEERNVTSDLFREQATHGIYMGLLNYFSADQ